MHFGCNCCLTGKFQPSWLLRFASSHPIETNPGVNSGWLKSNSFSILIAKILSSLELNSDKKIKYFIQVNIGDEPQKNGIQSSLADEFIRYCKFDLSIQKKSGNLKRNF